MVSGALCGLKGLVEKSLVKLILVLLLERFMRTCFLLCAFRSFFSSVFCARAERARAI